MGLFLLTKLGSKGLSLLVEQQPSRPTTDTFENKHFSLCFFRFISGMKENQVQGEVEFTECTYTFTVYLYLKYTLQRASTLSKLQQHTVCACMWRPACCGGGLLEDMGCALQVKQSKNLSKLHFIT